MDKKTLTSKATKKALREEITSLHAAGAVKELTERQKHDTLTRLFSGVRLDFRDCSICAHCGTVIPAGDEGRPDTCPRCGDRFVTTLTTKEFPGEMHYEHKWAAKYDEVVNPETGHVFHVESVYACFLVINRVPRPNSTIPEIRTSVYMSLCYRNWFINNDGVILRGVMAMRLKMECNWQRCPFAVGPMCYPDDAHFRFRTPTMHYGYATDWWDFVADTVIGRREDTDWFNAWNAQFKDLETMTPLWL